MTTWRALGGVLAVGACALGLLSTGAAAGSDQPPLASASQRVPQARFLGNFSNVAVSSESGDCSGLSAQLWVRPILKEGRVQPVWQPYGFLYEAAGNCPGIEFRITGGEYRPGTRELHLSAGNSLGFDIVDRIAFNGFLRAGRLEGTLRYADPNSGVLPEEGEDVALDAADARRWREIGPFAETATSVTAVARRAADEAVLRVREVSHEFKVEVPVDPWTPEGPVSPPVTYRELDITWSYPIFLDGKPEEIGRLNAWLRRWWLEGIGDCGAELPIDRLAAMSDEEVVAQVKATSKSDDCGTIQSAVLATGGFGPYLSFTRYTAMAGAFHTSHAREDMLIHRDTLAPVALSDLFDERAILGLSAAFEASVAREHPDCHDLPLIDRSTLRVPDLLAYERPYKPSTWRDCEDVSVFMGIQVRRALKPEVRAMTPVRTELVNWRQPPPH
ncbi:hypothetical protein ACQ86G_12300 [Roseateles chitinivorans]|uniref:hypothetical protein n=1 Tax=Roseateles chitinivorans TaxID=2917965 RepID=UPI003D677B9E